MLVVSARSPYHTLVGYLTRALYWIARAAVSGALLSGVLAMHALTGPYPSDAPMTAGSITGMSAMAGLADTDSSADATPTGILAAAVSAADTSMCGHTPCVAILRGHVQLPVPGQLGRVGVLLDTLNPAGASEGGLLSSQRAPPPGAALTRLCISRT